MTGCSHRMMIMDREEIIRQFLELLKFHMQSEASVYQSSYKYEFFALFKEAYQNGYIKTGSPILTADSLAEVIATRWHTGDDEENELKQDMAWKILAMWREWQYAWERYDN